MSKGILTGSHRKMDIPFKEAAKSQKTQDKRDRHDKKFKGGKQNPKSEENGHKTVYLPVWMRPQATGTTKLTDEERRNFVWPEYKSESERIKLFSKRYKDVSIAEAFARQYDQKVSTRLMEAESITNSTPTELHEGDTIKLSILNITKDGVIFDTMNYKQVIVSNTNMHRYERFKHFTPKDPIACRVVSATPTKVVVDPFRPMFEEWLKDRIKHPVNQRRTVDGCDMCIKVKDLRLSGGGFIGRAVIPNISEFIGEDYTVEAFIPGSHIVLNVEHNFDQWNGKTVEAFVTSYIPKPGTQGQMSLVCSVKDYLRYIGDCNLVTAFKSYCENGQVWNRLTNTTYIGEVTGVLHSESKCGVFVELPQYHITGMVPMPGSELAKFKPTDKVEIRWTDIEEQLFREPITGQLQHVDPYVYNDDVLVKCTLKPVFKFA